MACGLAQANDLTWVFRFAIEATVRIGLIVSYMLVFEWRLALVAIAIIPVVGAINKWYGNWLHANQEKVQASLASANSVAHGAPTRHNLSLVSLFGTFDTSRRPGSGFLFGFDLQ